MAESAQAGIGNLQQSNTFGLGGTNSNKSSTTGTEATATPFVCYACAGETQRRSVAVATDGGGGDVPGGIGAGSDLLAAGKPRIPGRGVQMHEKLLAQNRGRWVFSLNRLIVFKYFFVDVIPLLIRY